MTDQVLTLDSLREAVTVIAGGTYDMPLAATPRFLVVHPDKLKLFRMMHGKPGRTVLLLVATLANERLAGL